jgi:peptidoglycan/LPS O-acetylase OafA/YrhL
MDRRITTLDSLRGIAAISVVLYHYTSRFRVKFGHDFSSVYDFKLGFYGVELFFIISGFVIFMTVEQCKDGYEFAFKRLTRLYPTYWLCLIISFTFLYFIGLDSPKPTIGEFLINLTMIQHLLHTQSVDGVYWSLLPELLFYLMIFLLAQSRAIKKIYIWGGVWLAASIISSSLSLYYHDTFLKFAGLFYTGVIFYKIYSGENTLQNHLMIIICYLVVLLNFRAEVYSIPAITFIYLLFYGFVFQKLKFLNVKLLRFLGLISYPLYLLHQEIGYTIMLYLRTFMHDGALVIITPLLIAVALASVVSIYFEKPIIKAARSFLESRIVFLSRYRLAK